MASLSFSITRPLITTSSPSSPSIRIPCPTKLNHSGFARRFPCKASATSSEGTGHDHNKNQKTPKFDRRDMLVGLGGLYGVAGLTSAPFAFAEDKPEGPIEAPDLTKCNQKLKDGPKDPPDVKCCPPTSLEIIDFEFPPQPRKLRIRRAAHKLDPESRAKYKQAMQLMRDLPKEDPRSFYQQANIHCAYCNGAYDQVGFPSQYIQVHGNWLFYPFHRWYLYFYETILGDLIGDPDFALPFWNWDSPEGYKIPSIFVDKTSSLYDEKRNQNHLPPAIADLNYVEKPTTGTEQEQREVNLSVMYRQMVNATKQDLFYGKPYRTKSPPREEGGSIENGAHIAIHAWCGDDREKNGEDMGHFYSTGRDPLFYSHHNNVDRLWSIWKKLGPNRKDINDPDYLNTKFLFYNEKRQLIRVKVGDSLDSRKLGYDYEDVGIPWLSAKPKPSKSKSKKTGFTSNVVAHAAAAEKKNKNIKPLSEFPITLDKTVSTVVKRPKKSRSKLEKEEEEEVLVIYGIDYDRSVPVKFDVCINDEDDDAPSGADNAEFAGSFATIPKSSHSDSNTAKGSLNLGISSVLDDLEADDDETIIVTLVPRSDAKVKIDGIKIEYLS